MRVDEGPVAAERREPDAERGRRDWPVQQPELPRRGRYFCYGNVAGCCPFWVVLIPPLGILGYIIGVIGFALLVVVSFAIVLICGCPLSSILVYDHQWTLSPWRWHVDLYTKATFLAYQAALVGRQVPDTSPKWIPVDAIRPKAKLEKVLLDYALNIKVPKTAEEEHPESVVKPKLEWLGERMSKLPMFDKLETFRDDEDPVKFVMKHVGGLFPVIYQDWTDKRSDIALTRLCLYGMGAHRVDTVEEGGARYFVVRTNALAGIPVRNGFARYGGDAYFDASWRPVKIVDAGVGPVVDDGTANLVTTRPNDVGWEEAKFRFRSSLSVLVTLVDHLYGVHLQLGNLMVTAYREQLSPNHPLRRFLLPFTYQTISVNDSARKNLVQPRSMGPRCFAFTDQGLSMAFAAAPRLLMSGLEIPAAEGGPMYNRQQYVNYLKEKKGIDSEYTRQSCRLWLTCRRFLEEYMAFYYPTPAHALQDAEIGAFIRQFTHQIEAIPAVVLFPTGGLEVPSSMKEAEGKYAQVLDLLASFMFFATGGHEQVGAIEAYVQDASFCAFKWIPGKLVGTKQGATAQALLMSFTSSPMPKLLGADWTHLFTDTDRPAPEGAKPPQQAFADFQAELARQVVDCDEYNAGASARPFPECFPLHTMNPRYMDVSIAV